MKLKSLIVLAAVVGGLTVAHAQLGRHSSLDAASVILLGNQRVQQELKLSQKQIDDIRKAFSHYADEISKQQKMYAKDRQNVAKYDGMLRKEQDILISKCLPLLSPAQGQRLQEIGLQHYGIFAVATPNIAKKLGLSADQMKRIEGARVKYRDEIRELNKTRSAQLRAVQQPKNPNDKKQVEAYRKKMQDLVMSFRTKDEQIISAAKKKYEAQATAVLSASQRTQYEKLKGKPFKA